MKKDEKTNQLLDIKWHEAPLFCLAFKIKEKLFRNCFCCVFVNHSNVKDFV